MSRGWFGGDVKPENVIIETSKNATFVDFGGGCTPEYIDSAVMDTKVGYLQGLAKLTRDSVGDRR